METLNTSPRDLFDEDGRMRCPVCTSEWTHPDGAATRMGEDEAEIYRGTTIVGTVAERRSALVVTCYCESGHWFALVIQQHKGQNYCHVEEAPRPADADV